MAESTSAKDTITSLIAEGRPVDIDQSINKVTNARETLIRLAELIDEKASSVDAAGTTVIYRTDLEESNRLLLQQISTTYQPKGNYLTEHQDISGKLDKVEAASLYQPKGNYLTEHQDISGKLDKTEAASLYQPKGNYITELPDLSGYATIEYVGANFVKKTDFVEGSKVRLSEQSYTTQEEYNNNATGLKGCVFTPEALGMVDGELLTSISLQSRHKVGQNDWLNNDQKCLHLFDVETGERIGITDIQQMTQFATYYTFTFAEPVKLHTGKTYRVNIYNFVSGSYVASSANLSLHVTSSQQSIYCIDHPTWRPIMSAVWTTPGTREAIVGIIDKRLSDVSTKLEPLRSYTEIGDNDYSQDELKDRLDVMLTVLKSFDSPYLASIKELEPFADAEYTGDELKDRCDALLAAMKSLL